MPCCDNDSSDRKRLHLPRLQLFQEPCRGRRAEQLLLASGRTIQESAVLSHHALKEMNLGKDREQLVQLATGDEDQPSSAGPKALQSRDGIVVDAAARR